MDDLDKVVQLATLLGMGATALAAVTWRLVTYINKVDEKRSKNVYDLHEKIDSTAKSFDGKFNGALELIDKLKDDTVRRDDLNLHLARIERGQESLTLAVDRLREQVNSGLLKITERMNGGPNHS